MKSFRRRVLAMSALIVASLISEAQARDQTIEGLRLGSGFEIIIGEKQIDPGGRLLEAIAIWVGAELGRSMPATLPKLVFKPVEQIAASRLKQYTSEIIQQQGRPNIISIYDSRNKSIYLPDSWTGETAADLSIIVHELVHHFQEMSETKFECESQREADAFELQERWLRLFGLSLEKEFQIDPFTLVMRTACGM